VSINQEENILKLAIITAFLGRTKDRFHEYNDTIGLEDKYRMMSEIEGATGVESIYPYEVTDPVSTKALADKYGLKFAAINVNVKAEPEFRNGGLTSADKGVRANAVRLIKEAKDFAEKVGADKVTCCPLGDGYEFSFQADYAVIWKRLIETFGEAADYKRNIPLFIEFKPSETRGTCYLNNTSKTLLLIKQIGIQELGITLDFGHAVYGSTNPAEELVLLAESGQPYYIHINDNDGKWDWDYFCGTKHLLEYAEFLYYLRKYQYDDFLTSDTSPTRWDIKGTFTANNRITNKLWNLLGRMDDQGFARMIGAKDYLATWKFIEENLFGLK
jgi:xylose isomerase